MPQELSGITRERVMLMMLVSTLAKELLGCRQSPGDRRQV